MHLTFKDSKANKCTKTFLDDQPTTILVTSPVFVVRMDRDDGKKENSRNVHLQLIMTHPKRH
jgi:hypothetical protein